MSTIDIRGLDKAEVVVALNSVRVELRPLERHPLLQVGPTRIMLNAGHISLSGTFGIDLGVSLAGDNLDTSRFDQKFGQGAAARALAPLIAKR